MSKALSVFVFIFSLSALAQNNSTTCRHEAYRYMNESDAYSYCQNVASNCFNSFVKKSGFYQARETCLNVASSCFTQSVKVMLKENAANICSDVNSSCFSAYYPGLKNIEKTIKKCSY